LVHIVFAHSEHNASSGKSDETVNEHTSDNCTAAGGISLYVLRHQIGNCCKTGDQSCHFDTYMRSFKAVNIATKASL